MENQDQNAELARIRADLLGKAREAPSSPGCYLMRDENGLILYVGKAKVLKSRVSSYFQAAPHEIARTELLVSRIRQFDTILTGTEAEALILECTLIKKHKPKFNVRLKDDKTYPYLKIAVSEDFPRIEWTRKVLKDGARYFGPFPSAWSARQVMRLLIETFQLRDCSDNTFRHRTRPCLLHQIGKCCAPCVGITPAKEYRSKINQVIGVLSGKTQGITRDLRKQMELAADREDFESAAVFRDQMRSLELITETQAAVEAGVHRDRDVLGLAIRDGEAHGAALEVREGKLLSVRHFQFLNTDTSLPKEEAWLDFLTQHYLDDEGSQVRRSVLLPERLPDAELLAQATGIEMEYAESEVDRQLLAVAQANAEYALEQQLRKRAEGHGVQALEEVQEKLHLSQLPARIECYDISNTQGEEAVASRVVFIDGAPDKNLYRRYKIKTVVGSNDFAMMKEVLGRRFSRGDEAFPDLVVVDGGKGQLSQAVAILEELGVQGVATVGLAKARTESDFQSSEVRSSMERIFIPGRKNPVALLPHTQAYKLLVHVRDEAHRFAIAYHRKLRSKRSLATGGNADGDT